MPQNITGNVKLSFYTSEIVADGVGSGSIASTIAYNIAFANGTGAGNIQVEWSKVGAPAASTPDTWTLSALTDDIGRSVAFTTARVVVIYNTHATTSLTIGLAATHPWAAPFGATGSHVLAPGSILILVNPSAAGLTVTSGTSDQLKIDPGASAGSYQIAIAGQ